MNSVGWGERYLILKKYVGLESEWITIASFSTPLKRDSAMRELFKRTEPMRFRNSRGRVIHGPIYKASESLREFSGTYHKERPCLAEIAREAAAIRRENNRVGHLFNSRETRYGRAIKPITVSSSKDRKDSWLEGLWEDHPMCDPWWIQIGS